MTGEFFIKQKRAVLLGMVASTLAIAACSDNLNAGKSCPLLCPEQAITLQDTIIDAVFADTTVLGIPSIGNEVFLMLSSHGDTLDSRAIIRYDTITQTFTGASLDGQHHHRGRQRRAGHADRAGRLAPSPDGPGDDRGVRRGHGGDRHRGVDPLDALPAGPVSRQQDVRAGIDHRHAAHSDLHRHGARPHRERKEAASRAPFGRAPGLRHSCRVVGRRAVGRAAHQGVQGHGGHARARDADLDDADGSAVPVRAAVGLQHPREGRDAD